MGSKKEKTTCFELHKKFNISCENKSCRLWMDNDDDLNCCNIAVSSKGNHTLQEIGDIFKISRMRVCQIEKKIKGKLKTNKHLKKIN